MLTIILNSGEYVEPPIDIIPPITTPSYPPGPFSGQLTIIFNGNEPLSDTFYTVNGGELQVSNMCRITETSTIEVYSMDYAGNVEAPQTLVYTLDTVPPVTTISPVAGSYGVFPTITLTSNKTGTTKYWINNGPELTYTNPVHLIGACTVHFYSIDTLGNIETMQSAVYSIDTTAPVTTISPIPGTFADTQEISFVVSKPNCTIMYSFNGIAYEVYTAPFNISVTTNITYYSFDQGGNVETSRIAHFVIDKIAPTTIPHPAPGTYGHSQLVSFTCNEVGITYYTINGGPTLEYSSPFTISEATTLTFWTVDTVGNTENVKTADYIFDTVAPVTTITPLPGTYGTAKQITLESSKPGITYYSINGSNMSVYTSPFVIPNTSLIAFYSVDLASNIEDIQHATFILDFSAPVTTIHPVPKLYSGGIDISFTANKACTTYYSIDGGPSTVYTDPIPVSNACAISYHSEDSLGHIEATRIAEYTFDVTPPVTTANLVSGTYWYKQPTKLVLETNESGTIFYSIDGGIDTPYLEPIIISATCEVKYYSVDLAGNIEALHTLSFNIVGDGFHDYISPIVLNNDATINYYLDFGDGTVENTHSSHYTIDLFPLVIHGIPSSRTYRHLVLDFALSKPGSVLYSINGSPFVKWHRPVTLPDGAVELRLYGTSELRVYPIITRNYIIDPNAVFLDIHPSPISVYQQPIFAVTLEARI